MVLRIILEVTLEEDGRLGTLKYVLPQYVPNMEPHMPSKDSSPYRAAFGFYFCLGRCQSGADNNPQSSKSEIRSPQLKSLMQAWGSQKKGQITSIISLVAGAVNRYVGSRA